MPAAVIHLDTNVLIAAGPTGASIRGVLDRWATGDFGLGVSALAWSEFCCGPVPATLVARWEFAIAHGIVPLDQAIAEHAASLFNASGRRTRSLPDCVIAATAIRHGARLATMNASDFKPFVSHGLVLA